MKRTEYLTNEAYNIGYEDGYNEAASKAISIFESYLAEFGCDDFNKRVTNFKQALEL